jgi:hypothetical protein
MIPMIHSHAKQARRRSQARDLGVQAASTRSKSDSFIGAAGVVNPCARAAASKAQSLRYRIQHPLQIQMFASDLRIIFSALD